jgi:hypothetical protein
MTAPTANVAAEANAAWTGRAVNVSDSGALDAGICITET